MFQNYKWNNIHLNVTVHYSTMIGAATLFQEGDDTTDSLLCLHLAVEVFNSHSSVILWSVQQLITPHIDITSVVYM